MKKANWFNADKAMAQRVEEFIVKKAEFITIRTRRQAEIDGLKARLASYGDPDRVVIEDAEKRAEYIAKVEKELEEVKATYQKLLDENATFSYTDNDKALYRAYKVAKNDEEVASAVCKWVKAYSKADGTFLDLTGTDALAGICDAIGGKRAVTARAHVQSEGKVFNGKRTQNDILKVFYGELAERMIAAGTVKTANFPEEIRAKYAPKKRG